MTQQNRERDSGKRGSDRKQSFGSSNMIWTLIAVAVAGLFAASLFGGSQEVQLSYSDLERLIRAAGERQDPSDPPGSSRSSPARRLTARRWSPDSARLTRSSSGPSK